MSAIEIAGGSLGLLYQALLLLAGWTFHRRLRNQPAGLLFIATLAVLLHRVGSTAYLTFVAYHYGPALEHIQSFSPVDSVISTVVNLFYGAALFATARSIHGHAAA